MYEEIALSLILGGMLGVFVGIFLDTYQRCKIMRIILRKNFVILSIVSKNRKVIMEKIVNLSKDTVRIGKLFWWVIEPGRIYRKDRPEIGGSIKEENASYSAGVPVIFVDYETVKPLFFHSDEGQHTNGLLTQAMMDTVQIETDKERAMMKKEQTPSWLPWVQLILLIVIIVLVWNMGQHPANGAEAAQGAIQIINGSK